jgi:acyl-CoA synthetase (AMP-forming)/AMP-acid ligase II
VRLAQDLARHGDRPALVDDAGVTSYAALAGLVAAAAERHLARAAEPLVLPVRPCREDVVTYLACLAAGRPVLLTDPDGATDELEARFGPRVGAPAPHPDLALLLSTSGSTGSPRLVRLGARAVDANAAAIAEYLGLRHDDVGITALPLHYCYGLSVLHSHLAVGAAVVLTRTKVVDPCFWAAVDAHGVTSLAGVPHSFEMLEASGRAEALARGAHPSLRLLTQAGGRMAPETVRAWARRGERGGFDLVVMYGQTEATARMAYLPAHLAAERPECVGVPVPGGDLRLDPVPGQPDGVGELVYTGPNVMMGYAEKRDDLARGHDLAELRTGDLGVQEPDGLWRVVGRLARFAKVMGLRVDLDRVEAGLADQGVEALAVEAGDRRAVGVLAPPAGPDRPADRDPLADLATSAARLAGLPEAAVTVVPLEEWPVLASGKPDRQRVSALAGREVTRARPRRHSRTAEGSQPQGPARDHEVHLVAGPPDPLVQRAEQVPEDPARPVRRDHPQTDLVGHQHHVALGGRKRGQHLVRTPLQQLRELSGRPPPGPPLAEHPGQPGAEAVDQHGCRPLTQGSGDVAGLDGAPRGRPARPVCRDPRRPVRVGVVVGRGPGCDVGRRLVPGDGEHQLLGMPRLARPDSAGHQHLHLPPPVSCTERG